MTSLTLRRHGGAEKDRNRRECQKPSRHNHTPRSTE
jgi:hypothetical protein